jgi:hypothetical protein
MKCGHNHGFVATRYPRATNRALGTDMKTIIAIILPLLLASPVIADTNEAPIDLNVVTMTAVPFALMYDGKRPLVVGVKTNGFEVVAVTTNALTLKRGDREIRVAKGQRVPYNEYVVTIMDKGNGSQYEVRTGHEIKIGARTFALGSVNLNEGSCTLRDVDSGEIRTIGTPKAQQGAPPLPRAPAGHSEGAR